ncbi:MAG: MBL fold metallo-hydrolase [Acidobacteriota bacterium]
MKRFAILSGILVVGTISSFAARQQPQPAQRPPVALEILKAKENLYVITGGGGNSAVFITEKGVVLVDTKNPGMGPGILEKIKSVTPKPVIMVINTHTHGDHVGSNSAFTGAVQFVSQENCKASMEKMPMFQTEDGKKFLSTRTYRDKLSLLSGNEKIDLYHFGPGHTSGDTFVVFPALRTMHSGDLFAGKSTPLIDTNNGGTALEYPRTLMKAAAGIKGVDTVIPGHSAVTDWAAFKEYGDFVRDLVAGIQQAKKDGKTVDQTSAELKLPEKYKDYQMGRLKDNVTKVYAESK